MTILYRGAVRCDPCRCLPSAPRPRPRKDRRMFSRWGAFVYRRRRPVALIAVLVAAAAGALGLAGLGPADVRRLARPELRVGPGRRPPRRSSSAPGGAASSSSSGATACDDARSPEFQAAIADDRSRRCATTRDVAGVVGYAETGDDRFISTDGDAAYVVIQLDTRPTRARSTSSTRIRDQIDPPAGYTIQLTGYAPAPGGLGRTSPRRTSSAPRRSSLPIARAHPHPRLRLARRGRDAARSSPGWRSRPRSG